MPSASLGQALLRSAAGSLAALVLSVWLWGWKAGPVVAGIASVLWVILVFAWRSVRLDEDALPARIKARLAQHDPVLRLAVALAQPMRGLALAMPIPAPARRIDAPGQYGIGHLSGDELAKAGEEVQAWLDHAQELAGGLPLPGGFAQIAALFLATPAEAADGAAPEPEPAAVLCYRLHVLLCGMETGALPLAAGRALVAPAVRALQARYPDWQRYAADLRQEQWHFVRRTLWGKAALAVHLKDLLGQPLSPWAITELRLALPPPPA